MSELKLWQTRRVEESDDLGTQNKICSTSSGGSLSIVGASVR